MFLDGVLITHWSRTQPTVTNSSCKSELVALHTAGGEAKLLQQVLQHMNQERSIVIHSESTAALATVRKRGPGRLKHMDIKHLWLQEAARAGELILNYVPSAFNLADLLTKSITRARLHELGQQFGLMFYQGQEEIQVISMMENIEPQEEELNMTDMWFMAVLCCAVYGVYSFCRNAWQFTRCQNADAEESEEETSMEEQQEQRPSQPAEIVVRGGATSSSQSVLRRTSRRAAFTAAHAQGRVCLCGLLVVSRQVRGGVNVGRWYISCPRAQEDPQRCSFFRWVEVPEVTTR